jgi:hypothetical protein
MNNRTLINNDKWDIRPNPNGSGLHICVTEDKGFFHFGIKLIGKIMRIPLYFLLRRQM